MYLSAFELEVLDRVFDDYEAVDIIRGDIALDLGRPVSEEEVASALVALAHSGLVDVFVYDATSSTYRPAEIDSSSVADLWFLTNKHGRSEYARFVA